MKFQRAIGAVLVVAAGCFMGCGRNPQKPAEAALIGTWRLSDKSFASATRRTGRAPKDSKIELLAGGRLIATDMPIADLSGPSSGPVRFRYFTGEGHWELDRGQDVWELHLGIEKGDHQNFFAKDIAAPSGFYTFVEDPDSGETWAWEKEK